LAVDASLLVHHTARLFTFAAAENGFYIVFFLLSSTLLSTEILAACLMA
jgi:hypothetical protein